MTRHVASTVTDHSISVFIDGEAYTISSEHPNFNLVRDALQDKNYDEIVRLMNLRTAVVDYLSKDRAFTLVGERVSLDGKAFSESITTKVLSMLAGGYDANPLFNFLRKVRLNPSATAQDELLEFCEVNDFMIHEDGDVLAYKSVRADWTDSFSGTISNHVGAVVTMDRGEVDDDRNRTCSFGLHFAAHEYASNFCTGGHLVVLKINPRDVVSIPSDYNNQKGRCCRYEVISELKNYKKLDQKEVYTNSDLGAPEPFDSNPLGFEFSVTSYEDGYETGQSDFDDWGTDAENPFDCNESAFDGWNDGFNDRLEDSKRF